MTKQTRDPRGRRMVRFWLETSKPEQNDMYRCLQQLRSDRQMTTVMRDALRLYFDLSNGNQDVLTELFPKMTSPSSNLKQLSDLHAKIDQLLAGGGSVRAESHGKFEIKAVHEKPNQQKIVAGALHAVSSFL